MNWPSEEFFDFKTEVIAGDECVLITPKQIGILWTPETLKFRSSIWRKSDGFPVSLSFKKFFNYGERSDHFPPPVSLDNTSITLKEDGSTLILSKYKNQFIIRTRGTFDASKLDNGSEIEIFKSQILTPLLNRLDGDHDTWSYSIIFEWTTPTNKIILDYGNTPQWFLIGFIDHPTYTLASQNDLDKMAKIHNWKRPQRFQFKDLVELSSQVKLWKDKEGVCLYFNNDQDILKIKADAYLVKHAFKEHASPNSVIDLFLKYNRPNLDNFVNQVTADFDYECVQFIQPVMVQVVNEFARIKEIEGEIEKYIYENVSMLGTRKEQAQAIVAKYSPLGLTGFVFSTLDKKPISDKFIKDTILDRIRV